MSAELSNKNLAIPPTNKIIDYWQLATDNWTRDNLKSYLKGGKRERVDVINLAFALPQQDGTLTLHGEMNADETKKIIKQLKSEGKKLTIAVGGAAGAVWNLESPNAVKKLAKSIKDLVTEYDLDGVDIDYEDTDINKRNNVINLIKEIRNIMPQNQYILSYAAWSIGAYGKNNPGHTHAEWGEGGNVGIDVRVLKEAGKFLDYVNVMSYDAFDPKMNYNPIEAIKAYSALMGASEKVVLGLELGLHAWPANVRTSSKQVEQWLQYAADNGFGGCMFWMLEKDKQSETLEKDGVFLEVASRIMPSARMKHLKDNADARGIKQKQPSSAAAEKPVKTSQDKISQTSAEQIKPTASEPQVPGSKISSAGAHAGNAPQVQTSKIASTGAKDTVKTQPDHTSQTSSAGAPALQNSSSLMSESASSAVVVNFSKESSNSKLNMEDEEQVKKLGITDLTKEHKESILKTQKMHMKKLDDLKKEYEKARLERNAQLKNSTATESEKAALEGQYKIQDEARNKQLESFQGTFQNQLQHIISEMRALEKRSKPRL